MKVRGPLVTLGVVAALGIGIWMVNSVSQRESEPAPSTPTAQAPAATTTPAPRALEPSPAPPPPAPAFPAKADYVGEIPTPGGVITLAIAVAGNKAIAYACDGHTIEAWRWGPAQNGTVKLWNKDRTDRLEGRLEGNSVVGDLFIDEQRLPFTTSPAEPPSGLYVYDEEGGIRTTWIVDQDDRVVGVRRLGDGSKSPAPALSTEGTAVIDGRTVEAVRVAGDSDI